MALGVAALAALINVTYSEWARIQLGRESVSRSVDLWRTFTLVDTAEADYQLAQWNQSPQVEESAQALRKYAQSFGELRSAEERAAVQNLNLFIAKRARAASLAQSAMVDGVFQEQMREVRTAIEKTDALEKRRLEVDMAQMRADMVGRLFYVMLALVAFLGLHWMLTRRRSSGTRRRRSTVKRFRVQ